MIRQEDADSDNVYLKPGELFIGEKNTKVTTILGSCVAVTLFGKRLRIGAICHGALPRCRKKGGCHDICGEAFKFVDCSIRYMLGKLRSYGLADKEIEVKVFGGADTLLTKKENTIGSMNVKIALELIRQEKLRIISADVGDSFGRKIIFLTHTGEVYLKRLKDASAAGQAPGITFKTRGK
jgi:chemotaxis protein CheD